MGIIERKFGVTSRPSYHCSIIFVDDRGSKEERSFSEEEVLNRMGNRFRGSSFFGYCRGSGINSSF